MHVDQLGGEVGIRPVGGDEQFRLDRTDDLHRRASGGVWNTSTSGREASGR